MPTSQINPSDLSPPALRAVARRLFTTGPLPLRLLQHHRPSICPFGAVLQQVPAGSSVLDIGCGGGLLLGLIAARRQPTALTGFDSAAQAIDLARANLNNFPEPRPQFLRLDVGEPWPPGPYDCVTMCDVLHHVPREHHAGLLRQTAAHLRPGGRFIYKDVYPEGLVRPNASRLHDLVIARERIHIPRIAEVTRDLAQAGLTRVHHERINTLWYGHELAVFTKP